MRLVNKVKAWVAAALARDSYVLHGVTLQIDRRIMSDQVVRSIARGRYEIKEARQAEALIKADDVVLELGGGIGLISTIAAKKASAGKVISVEGNPQLIAAIEKMHKLNGVDVEVLNGVVAGGQAGGNIPFYLREPFWGSSMSETAGNYQKIVLVPSWPISDLVSRYRPSVVLVDIEGGEGDLMAGDWCSGVRAIMMELHPKVIGIDGAAAIKSFFAGKGFQVDEPFGENVLVMTRRA